MSLELDLHKRSFLLAHRTSTPNRSSPRELVRQNSSSKPSAVKTSRHRFCCEWSRIEALTLGEDPMATQTKTTQLTDAERMRRQQIIDEARTMTELEGGRSSDEVRALQDQWVRGELTRQEMSAEVRRLRPSIADR